MYSSDYLYTQLLALRHSNITPITLDDYSLYQEYFQREPRMDAYADTFTYITQSCRGFGLGMKYLSDTQLFSIGCHQNHFVVVRPIGLLDDSFMGLLNQLYHLSEKPVFLKKIFDDQLDSLLKLGNFEWVMHKNEDGSLSYGNTIWSIDCPADDDTYPELIYTGDLLQQSSKRIDEWASYFVTRRANNLNGVSLKSYKDDMGKYVNGCAEPKRTIKNPELSESLQHQQNLFYTFLKPTFMDKKIILKHILTLYRFPLKQRWAIIFNWYLSCQKNPSQLPIMLVKEREKRVPALQSVLHQKSTQDWGFSYIIIYLIF